ncbi:MAG TPA: bifunctional diaminohydroxyphosphoribosylaminopyrimidine deaminase/5-amino-6-(5-phosphoribosylamino)uracil reductase RibD [Pseudolabrys sp.]|nr:bifunctional diaminohydroxyphosphoribosylaminopyrimidine deaminase/5-amino-6-(5-phosphoribosylamino)uracil reductase RibD [Pseudolabrys sp.]
MSEAAVATAGIDAAQDMRFMQLALALGRRGLGRTWPNPAVGAVLVKDGIIVGRGWTQPGGRPHAETEALKHARKAARGATLYVTLEPCSHQGKTPPCADAIISAGVTRVVSAMEDPNPDVAGKGHERLRARGIAVEVGLGSEEARRDHVGHIARMRDGRPHVLLKLAVSADGKAAHAGRKPAAITGEAARERVFWLRAQSDAILIGMGTALSDNPALTCRLPGMLPASPVRVLFDAKLQVPIASNLVATARETPTWVFGARNASTMAEEILTAKGVEVLRLDARNGLFDLKQVLKLLTDKGISRLMVEGGPRVAASFVKADLVDEALLFRGPKPIGADGIDALDDLPLSALTQSSKLVSRGSEPIGADTLEHFERR